MTYEALAPPPSMAVVRPDAEVPAVAVAPAITQAPPVNRAYHILSYCHCSKFIEPLAYDLLLVKICL